MRQFHYRAHRRYISNLVMYSTVCHPAWGAPTCNTRSARGGGCDTYRSYILLIFEQTVSLSRAGNAHHQYISNLVMYSTVCHPVWGVPTCNTCSSVVDDAKHTRNIFSMTLYCVGLTDNFIIAKAGNAHHRYISNLVMYSTVCHPAWGAPTCNTRMARGEGCDTYPRYILLIFEQIVSLSRAGNAPTQYLSNLVMYSTICHSASGAPICNTRSSVVEDATHTGATFY